MLLSFKYAQILDIPDTTKKHFIIIIIIIIIFFFCFLFKQTHVVGEVLFQPKPLEWMTQSYIFGLTLCTISIHTHFILTLLNVALNRL